MLLLPWMVAIYTIRHCTLPAFAACLWREVSCTNCHWPHLPEKGLNVIQSHPLHEMCTLWPIPGLISCAVSWSKNGDCCFVREMQSDGWPYFYLKHNFPWKIVIVRCTHLKKMWDKISSALILDYNRLVHIYTLYTETQVSYNSKKNCKCCISLWASHPLKQWECSWLDVCHFIFKL